MLRPKAVEAYDQTLNSVVDDLITKLRLRRSSQGLVTDIASEFYRFGLEGEGECPTRTTAVVARVSYDLIMKHFSFNRRRFLGAVRVQNRLPGQDRPRGDGAFHSVHQYHVCDDAPHHGDAELDAPTVPQTLERLLPVLGLYV